ncbi:hypothetical protein M422DRAFT_55507 [Sphaerobolus stellatus SS14]|uniref:Uncharacterized protein n=1 Tax=Sphaerobolus stellatus (strain SS14) TaxID=990650 RepID=A0A0C9UBL3_SPHS4|nr:hypothetical protein M422DRAFT_55507 [Sphaerobolus stellatus SS14]
MTSKEGITFETVWDGSTPKPNGILNTIAQPSNEWAIVEVVRESAVNAVAAMDKRGIHWPFKFGLSKQATTQEIAPMLTVSKSGRTTGRTLGTVNGVKSIYRLPRDGLGVRREDWAVLSYPWGGAFAYPGDAGAVIYAHEIDDIDQNNNLKRPGKPCGIIVGASTSGHVTFIQEINTVVKGVKEAGLGNMTFIGVGAPDNVNG